MASSTNSNSTLDLFKQPKALDSQAHRQLRYAPNQPYHFAAQQMFAPIVAGEASMVAREYAIVFSDTPGSLPLALLGASKGHNAYVRPSGHWMARYVPAHLRRYPFVMAEAAAAPQGEGASEISHIVVVDADAPHLSADEGDRLFNDAGEPSEALLKVQRVLLMMERDNLRTLAMVAQLEAAGLLVPQQVTVAKKQGQHIGLQGLRVVDAERLAALEPQALADLQRSGALELVYAHRLSLANLQDGVLCEVQEAEPLGGSSGSISFEGIDWSKF